MTLTDWIILILGLAGLTYLACLTRRLNKGVAFYVAANRCAGRYLLTMSEGMGNMSAASFIAIFEMQYKSGFVLTFWSFLTTSIMMLAPLSGFMLYRFRETRCLTLAQFCEVRYSRGIRILTGILSFVGGVLNFTIVPAIAAKFLVSYLNIPSHVSLGGCQLSTYAAILFLMMSVAVIFTFWGGQITILVTDTVQGMASIAICCGIGIYLLWYIDWDVAVRTLAAAPAGYSLVNPMDAGEVENFNFAYVILTAFFFFYYFLGNPGIQGTRSAALTAHELKMGAIIGNYRLNGIFAFTLVASVLAYVCMNAPEYQASSSHIQMQLNEIPNAVDRFQAITPLFLGEVLPVGMVGLFVMVMLMSYISTDDTYIHGWSTVFLQDIVIPIHGKPLDPVKHMRYLKLSIIGLALFVYIVALNIRQTQHIFMFWLITGALWGAGGGTLMIGGLYWKHAKTSGAWAAMIVGALSALAGFLCTQFVEGFPLDGAWCLLYSILIAGAVFVVVSLLDRSPPCNMDKLLHRGRYAVPEDVPRDESADLGKWEKRIGITREFSSSDKSIYWFTLIYHVVVMPLFALVLLGLHALGMLDNAAWSRIWLWYCVYFLGFAVICSIWMIAGGVKDIRALFRRLRKARNNPEDDGTVERDRASS